MDDAQSINDAPVHAGELAVHDLGVRDAPVQAEAFGPRAR